MFELTDKNYQAFKDIQLTHFREKVITELDEVYPYFPEITGDQKKYIIARYIESAFNNQITKELAVLNYTAASWLIQNQADKDKALLLILNNKNLDEIAMTTSLRRKSELMYIKSRIIME